MTHDRRCVVRGDRFASNVLSRTSDARDRLELFRACARIVSITVAGDVPSFIVVVVVAVVVVVFVAAVKETAPVVANGECPLLAPDRERRIDTAD